jgi:hypothetical protein
MFVYYWGYPVPQEYTEDTVAFQLQKLLRENA